MDEVDLRAPHHAHQFPAEPQAICPDIASVLVLDQQRIDITLVAQTKGTGLEELTQPTTIHRHIEKKSSHI